MYVRWRYVCASCDAGLALCGKAGLANTCTCPGSAAATGASCAYEGVFVGASCGAGLALGGNTGLANTGNCAGSAAAARPSCTSDGDIFVQVATRASPCVAKQVWPTLAPALVAPRLLGLLAHTRAFLLVQVAARASPCVATQVWPTLATALVAPRLLGLLVRPRAIYLCKLRRGLHLEWQSRSGHHLHLPW